MNYSTFNSFRLRKTLHFLFAINYSQDPKYLLSRYFFQGLRKNQALQRRAPLRRGQTFPTWSDSTFLGLTFSPLSFLVRRETVFTQEDCGLKRDDGGKIS